MKVVIQNLPRDVSEDEIREALRPFTSIENPVDEIAAVPSERIDLDAEMPCSRLRFVGPGRLSRRHGSGRNRAQ
jgi:hypothetical protein